MYVVSKSLEPTKGAAAQLLVSLSEDEDDAKLGAESELPKVYTLSTYLHGSGLSAPHYYLTNN